MEFTGVPGLQRTATIRRAEDTLAAQIPEALRAPPDAERGHRRADPIVDVTMRMQEGKQYFVNRITFTGNTTTRDNVIRREMRLVEGGVFNTEALKYSVRRLNQLGYFKNLEGNDKDMKVDKTPGKTNTVDVTLKFEEQNRNQLTFGAGVSQYEGVFGQLAFQTSNFLGRGESLTVSMTGRRPLAELPARRSPSRSCSTATSPAASTSSSARCSTSATTRRSRPAATSMFGVPGGRLQPHVRQLLVRDEVGIADLNEALHRPVVSAARHRLLDHLVGRRSRRS